MVHRRRRAVRAAAGLTVTAVSIGVGSSVVSKAGGSPSGLAALSSFQPVLGATVGAGLVIGELRELNKRKKRRR